MSAFQINKLYIKKTLFIDEINIKITIFKHNFLNKYFWGQNSLLNLLVRRSIVSSLSARLYMILKYQLQESLDILTL